MAGRKKPFPCGHVGKGQYCHTCEQEDRAREQRQSERRSVDEQPLGVLNLHEALTLATRLGCVVAPVRRTGEVRVSHSLSRSVVVNNRRKDAPRALLKLLTRLDPKSNS